MTREIKFRAWDWEYKIMYTLIYGFDDKLLYHKVKALNKGKEVIRNITTPIKDIELMQFIGLKDKNGKEIYEGDIVVYERDILTNKPKRVYIVEWDDDSCGFFTDVPKYIVLSQGEVIGNKFENPELLK